MPLEAGSRLGVFEILAPLGKGGMGEVYRARDAKLSREVAVKVLPEALTQDPDRLARFQREATLLAALNHSHIASIYGLEEADGSPFLVLELAPGEDLSERIGRGPIRIEEALEIARQIAEALEEAHSKGIVHRDLKPANVKLTDDGKIKVLDFGLAKAYATDDVDATDVSQSPTMSARATQAGLILGTAAYMSPEQARGDAIDKRADIWAFGVVLFEMLTGRRLFEGRSVSDVLASVLKDEPPWSQLPRDLPRGVERVLKRCLARDAQNRFRDVGDIALALEDAGAEQAAGRTRAPTSRAPFVATVFAVLAATIGLIATQVWRKADPPRLRRSSIPVSGLVTAGAAPTISPDGQKVVYLTSDGLWLHRLDSFDPVRIYEGQAETPFFSWDSERIAFTDDARGLWQVRIDGSARRLICQLPTFAAAYGIWLADDTIIFSPGNLGKMFRVPASGGQPVEIDTIDTRGRQLEFALSGEGRYVFIDFEAGGIEMFSEGKWTTLASEPDLTAVAYSKTGHLVYHRIGSGMWALPFDPVMGEITGGAFQIDRLGGSPSFSDAGRLIYPRGRDRSEMVRTDRDGKILGVIGDAQFMLQDPALSPDGRWVAVFSREQGQFGTWLHEVDGNMVRRLTFDIQPVWTSVAWAPDGHLYIAARDGGIWRKHVSGSSGAERLLDGTMPHVSSDGRTLAFWGPLDEDRTVSEASPRRALQYVNLVEGGKPRVFPTGVAAGARPRFSPDGKWLAYTSLDAGRTEIFLRRFPTGEGPWQVSTNGGDSPRWSVKGDEIFFAQEQQLMGVKIRTEPTIEMEPPVKLLDLLAPSFKEYEVYGDGFILVRPTDEISQIAVVDHWELDFQSQER